MEEKKHEFKFRKKYDEKYGKKVEKETKPETQEEKERKEKKYQEALRFLEDTEEKCKGRYGSINDDYYEYLRREYLNLDSSAVGEVLSEHPELENIYLFIAHY